VAAIRHGQFRRRSTGAGSIRFVLGVTSNQVQAASAVAVVLLTGGLYWATRQYVKWTKTMAEHIAAGNELQREANRITASGVAIAQGQRMPRLMAQQRGRSTNAATVEVPMDVYNLGGGPATSVVVLTDWGEAPVQLPVVPASDPRTTEVRMARGEWDQLPGPEAEKNPKVVGFRFRGPTGELVEVDAEGHPLSESG
jgi:hypothetical protein